MIKNIVDYSKAIYHLENLEGYVRRAKEPVNTEDISVEFLFNCMKEKIDSMEDMENKYRELINSYFEYGYYKIEGEKRFHIFNNRKQLEIFLKEKSIPYSFVIENIGIFLTSERTPP